MPVSRVSKASQLAHVRFSEPTAEQVAAVTVVHSPKTCRAGSGSVSAVPRARQSAQIYLISPPTEQVAGVIVSNVTLFSCPVQKGTVSTVPGYICLASGLVLIITYSVPLRWVRP